VTNGGRAGDAHGWTRAFWLLFEHAYNAAAVLDDKRRFVAINRQAQRLLGCSNESVRGRSITESVVAADRQRTASGWQSLLKGGRHEGTGALIHHDGREIAVRFVGCLMTLDEQQLAMYLAIPESPDRRLTAREFEVVELVARGHATSEIAKLLIVSPATVRAHVRNAMRKVGARTRAQLVAIALFGYVG